MDILVLDIQLGRIVVKIGCQNWYFCLHLVKSDSRRAWTSIHSNAMMSPVWCRMFVLCVCVARNRSKVFSICPFDRLWSKNYYKLCPFMEWIVQWWDISGLLEIEQKRYPRFRPRNFFWKITLFLNPDCFKWIVYVCIANTNCMKYLDIKKLNLMLQRTLQPDLNQKQNTKTFKTLYRQLKATDHNRLSSIRNIVTVTVNYHFLIVVTLC